MPEPTANDVFVLALQHHRAGRLVDAERLYRQVLAQAPEHADAVHNLGVIANLMGQSDLALELTRRAIAIDPNSADSYCNLGNALKNNGDMDGAIAAFRRALELQPDLADVHSNLAYTMYFHPRCDAKAIAAELRRWDRYHGEPLRKFIPRHSNDRNPDRRLRIGYVSPDFRDHCQSFFTTPLLSAHDRRQVEVFCYSDWPGDDAVARRLRGLADQWRTIAGQSDQAVAAMIQGDRIDILVDLTMHMANNRLLAFARKPAPVQVCWLAYPGSTGLSTMDYRLSDPYLDPPGMDESIYSETTIRLPDSFWCYDPLAGGGPAVNPLPAKSNGFVTFGCLNNFAKMNEGLLAVWGEVMSRMKGSRLLTLAQPGWQRKWVLDHLARAGIEPGRVEFAARCSRREYLALYHRIDLSLDSFPVNGHTTSLDSFWMGTPVVTWVGQTTMGRGGWSLASNLGLRELAADTAGQFVETAVQLANDPPRLDALRATLRRNMMDSPLMDAPRFARNVESAYRRMWHKWCGDNQPRMM